MLTTPIKERIKNAIKPNDAPGTEPTPGEAVASRVEAQAQAQSLAAHSPQAKAASISTSNETISQAAAASGAQDVAAPAVAPATARYNILLIEDDPHIARLVEANLQKAGLYCHHASDGKSRLFAFGQHTFHLVLLDLMLPDTNGYDICTRIRQTSAVPIIMITARDGAEDQLHGLKVGADDYVTKPFDPKLLVARVAANLRRVHRYSAPEEAATASRGGVPEGWSKCPSCQYMGPNAKFEEINDQFKMSMRCPHCSAKLPGDNPA